MTSPLKYVLVPTLWCTCMYSHFWELICICTCTHSLKVKHCLQCNMYLYLWRKMCSHTHTHSSCICTHDKRCVIVLTVRVFAFALLTKDVYLYSQLGSLHLYLWQKAVCTCTDSQSHCICTPYKRCVLVLTARFFAFVIMTKDNMYLCWQPETLHLYSWLKTCTCTHGQSHCIGTHDKRHVLVLTARFSMCTHTRDIVFTVQVFKGEKVCSTVRVRRTLTSRTLPWRQFICIIFRGFKHFCLQN